MRRRDFGLGLLAAPALAGRASASDASVVRLLRQYGLPTLPLMVMEHEKLVEKHAARLGMPSLKVEWPVVGGPGAMIDSMLTGDIDFGIIGAPGLVTMWDKTVGTSREIRALGAVQLQPFVLVTTNAAVKTIADFTDKDRIALPTAKISGQAIVLQMAAAKLWGNDQFERLDSLTLTLPHPEGAAAVMSGKSQVNSHYTVSPYYVYELATPGIHRVLKSYETFGGPHVNGLLGAAPKYRTEGQTIARIVYDAQREANAFIYAHPEDAAAIYVKLAKESHTLKEFVPIVADADNVWTTTPKKLMEFASFMHTVGRVKHVPDGWKDFILPGFQEGEGG